MQNNIIQGSEEWLQAKQSKIGGSEIYALAFYYCRDELEKLGVDLAKDQPFQTALELYLKVKFDIKQPPIPVVSAEFGNGMEDYIVSRINHEMSDKIGCLGSKDFIVDEKIHPLACCSPDGYIEIKQGQILRDFDDKKDIDVNMSVGTLELKTTPYGFNFEAAEGPKFQYIFQLMYNMLLLDSDWGMLACLAPKEKEFDEPFEMGKTLGMLNMINKLQHEVKEDLISIELSKKYNLHTYVYPIIKPIQDICKLALSRFQKALDDNKLPNISKDNEAKLVREKKMLAQIHPKRFDTLIANKELDDLLNERFIINNEMKKIKTEKEINNCELIKAMKDHIKIEGSNGSASFDCRGALRVIRNKNA